MSESAPPYLQAEGISRRFGGVVALDDVTLEVHHGECVALVGESGSGKTTLLRCFNRMVEPDDGRVSIGGEDVASMDPFALRRRTGYVQQEGGLMPHWRVLRNAALVPWLRGSADADQRAAEALERVGLPVAAFGERWPSELSGGQRQRVALARAMADDPEVLLLDEPFGALDAITRVDVQSTFAALRADGSVTTVLVTHDLREAVLLADRIAVMRAGRIEQIGTSEQLVSRPETDYVARLLSRTLRSGDAA